MTLSNIRQYRMIRTIRVNIDHNSWPQFGPPFLPESFLTAQAICEVDLPSMLLVIGRLTTPITTQGTSLSEYWAQVRYLSAFTDEDVLRLKVDYDTLDPHQKTILSDDFGMGIPMYWLASRLNFSIGAICDGRYFIESMADNVGAYVQRARRRGAYKSPDFVVRDHIGKWHVIECKGTQSGTQYSHGQFRRGITQKNTIRFADAIAGQRLVCGLTIARFRSRERTTLRIVDPDIDGDTIEVSDDKLNEAQDIVGRSNVAISLRLAGFPETSRAIASPYGPTPLYRRDQTFDATREFIRRRKSEAREELQTRFSRSRFQGARGRNFIGREFQFELPSLLFVHGRPVRSIFVRQGIAEDFVKQLSETEISEEADTGSTSYKGQAFDETELRSEEKSASLQIGESYLAEIELRT